jgi:hypothetical protein
MTSRPTDVPVSRFTDAEWARHRIQTEDLLAAANKAGLASDVWHTRDGGGGQVWTRERSAQHDMIIESIYGQARDVPNDRQAILAGGPCGAGKTTVLREHPRIDRSQYLTISSDEIKEELARRGMVPEVEGLSPMEASDLVHRESSYIARQLAMRARADGKNLIFNIQMSSLDSTKKTIDHLRAAGYASVEGIFVEAPADVSLRRVDSRHRAAEEAYRSGTGLGGRYVPPEAMASQQDRPEERTS